jgi:hypothetical protein
VTVAGCVSQLPCRTQCLMPVSCASTHSRSLAYTSTRVRGGMLRNAADDWPQLNLRAKRQIVR